LLPLHVVIAAAVVVETSWKRDLDKEER
jgi:hypothetical protein